ncbi:DUF4469 domain-containing protein [Candidatus Electronema sp. PJ]|uniref:DUF4469 domain-containing protein n=1 Tax=Candidatus Electronema sp. PJ TaxID=3401572 RepID=UPI003AA826CC
MATLQWRPAVNALTKPVSYRIQIIPRNIAGYEEMAADISAAHPNYNADLVRSLAPLMMEWIQDRMINGDQVTLPNAFIFRVSAQGRLNSPDAPLPDDEDMLQVSISGTRDCTRRLRTEARLERLPVNKKLPNINSAEDTKLKLVDVLNPVGLLRLTGSNLYFDEDDPDCGCVIQGTESGEKKQSTFGNISNSEILLAPDIPAQAHPWNNEYVLSLTTQYTEHGTPRTGIYERRLRTPLTVPGLGAPNPPETGILTDDHATSHVSINGGATSANERLRIQVIQDLVKERLLFSLIDMKEDGTSGAEIPVTQNGEYILPGFAGSAVSSIEITVNNYAALWEMIRNYYNGRLVDVLDVMV